MTSGWRDRNYAARFVGESRPVYHVGVNYDPKSRTIDDVKAESAAGAEKYCNMSPLLRRIDPLKFLGSGPGVDLQG